MTPTLLALSFLACSPQGEPTTGTWLQGASYGWELFNHRVAHIEWGVGDAGVEASIIGGTSTTGVQPVLADGCDPDTCDELPFLDDSNIDVRWVQATSDVVSFTQASVEVLAGASGAETSVELTLPEWAQGDSFALIQRFSVDTDEALTGGESCYHPAYGWQPKRIALTLGSPIPGDGDTVSVPVSAAFEAGESLEEMRECIDDVNDQAQARFVVDIVVVTTPQPWVDADFSYSQSYAYGDGPASPDEQPDPDLSQRPLDHGLNSPLVGWSRLDWSFHVDDPDDRGAYIRTLSFDADTVDNYATGHATNYSPITQLSGFDYVFAGTVHAFELDAEGTSTSGTVAATIPAELDADEVPVVQVLGW